MQRALHPAIVALPPRKDATMKLLPAALLALALLAGGRQARAADNATEQPLRDATQAVLDAQSTFDQPALDALLAPDYLEISPIGDVDERAEVLSFYSADAKAKATAGGMLPLSSLASDMQFRIDGDHAIVIALDTVRINVGAAEREVAMRLAFHFRRIDGKWLLQTAQYTPQRPGNRG